MNHLTALMILFLIAPFSAELSQLPFSLDSDCLVNFISGNLTSTKELLFATPLQKYIATYTIHKLVNFNYVIEQDEIKESNFSINDRYFRFHGRGQVSCIVFMFSAMSFQDTLLGIYNSGFSTSDEVMFFIQAQEISENDSMLYSFGNNLFASDSEPFHAAIAFFASSNNSSVIGVHCYFCPNKLVVTDNLTLSKIHQLSSQLNSVGHDQKLQFRSPTFDSSFYLKDCLISLDQLKLRQPIYRAMQNCPENYLVIICLFQQQANLTVAEKEDQHSGEWFLRLVGGEAAFLLLPNFHAYTRGSHWLLEEVPLYLISCINVYSLSDFDFTFSDVFPWPLLVSLFAVSLAYAKMYEDVSRGIDTIWPYLGMPNMIYEHPRKLIGFSLISASIFWYTYDAYVCTDCMHIAEFPSLAQLFTSKYKYWLSKNSPKHRSVSFFKGTSEIRFLTEPILRLLNGMTWEAFLYQNDYNVWELGVVQVVEKAVSEKLFVHALDRPDLLSALRNSDKFIKRKYMCHLFNIVADVPLTVSLQRSARVYGYMSKRFTWLINKGMEMGLFQHATSFKNSLGQIKLGALQMTDATSFVEPTTVSVLESPIGISSFYQAGVGIILLAIFVYQYCKKEGVFRRWWQIIETRIAKQRILVKVLEIDCVHQNHGSVSGNLHQD